MFGGSTNASGKGIKIDGTSFDIPTTQILEISLDAGSHSVTKDDSINLFYMAYVPVVAEEHTHSYVDEETKEATCTEAGLITYICSCGDSYTETVDAKGHSFVDGFCVDCGIEDPTDPDTPHEHSFVDGKCECGEIDPDYVPETPTDPEPEVPEEPEKPKTFWDAIVAFFKAIGDFFAKLFGIK